MSNNLRENVLNGFNYQMPQFQVSSAYTKRANAKNVKNGPTYPVLPYLAGALSARTRTSFGIGQTVYASFINRNVSIK